MQAWDFKACLHRCGGPRVGKVTRLAVVEKKAHFNIQSYKPGMPG